MSWELELWVEGPTDAGADGFPESETEEPTGALVPIVRAVLQALSGLSQDAFARVLPEASLRAHLLRERLRTVSSLLKRRRKPVKGRVQKVLQAFDTFSVQNPKTLYLAFWDRDSDPRNLRDRDEIHAELRESGRRALVVGVCVEKVEAWLLADAGAFKRCFGRGPERGLPGDPESIGDPKQPLRDLLDQYDPDRALGSTAVTFREIAKQIDLDVLATHCPKGFGRFQEDAKEFVVPLLTVSPGGG